MQMNATFLNLPVFAGLRTITDRLVHKRLLLGGLALALIGAGLAWQWSWLVAIGAAPLLVTAAPCVAMCALGLCMHRMSSPTAPDATAESSSPQQEI
jgi:hypothetical protein